MDSNSLRVMNTTASERGVSPRKPRWNWVPTEGQGGPLSAAIVRGHPSARSESSYQTFPPRPISASPQDIQMPNGKWRCRHACSNGTKSGKPCKHQCCHEGLDHPPNPRPPAPPVLDDNDEYDTISDVGLLNALVTAEGGAPSALIGSSNPSESPEKVRLWLSQVYPMQNPPVPGKWIGIAGDLDDCTTEKDQYSPPLIHPAVGFSLPGTSFLLQLQVLAPTVSVSENDAYNLYVKFLRALTAAVFGCRRRIREIRLRDSRQQLSDDDGDLEVVVAVVTAPDLRERRRAARRRRTWRRGSRRASLFSDESPLRRPDVDGPEPRYERVPMPNIRR
ncbi:hypothetical protein F4778DRAFT_102414 [Xylariomycetidae sp. FL2044]|nr:hypothetical protein F4778DRAFT_102414 [Xylariomycetidae sp. FL2044]